jgi:CheY-like chemotaxis protein
MGLKARVILADDHRSFLKSVSDHLKPRFEIVAETTDGRAALEAAASLDPDLIVLDIAMPKLNGIQTASELRRCGSRARIVFLTFYGDDDYVAAAFEAGAIGFVFKVRLQTDLIPALEHAYAGYRFVSPQGFVGRRPAPPVATWFQRAGGFHAMQFYRDEHERLASATAYVTAALKAGAAVVYVDSVGHLRSLELSLEGLGVNPRDAIEQGQFVTLDVHRDVLPRILNGSKPDPAEMTALFNEVGKRIPASIPSNLIAVAGEISPVLWAKGLLEAAFEVERLSDEFICARSASLFCTYPAECLHKVRHHEMIARSCRLHTTVPEPN